jgi:NAD(P)-dependent dehydrogenase (short-subunit alcohol dehydrogenase family)
LIELLLSKGTSVVVADLKLTPDAEALLAKYPYPSEKPDLATAPPSAVFRKTDVTDWTELQAVFDFTIERYGGVNIVVPGAGLFEPPASSFWVLPGVDARSADKADAKPGVFLSYSVNVMHPLRLAQIAVDYWILNRDVEANLLCESSHPTSTTKNGF